MIQEPIFKMAADISQFILATVNLRYKQSQIIQKVLMLLFMQSIKRFPQVTFLFAEM